MAPSVSAGPSSSFFAFFNNLNGGSALPPLPAVAAFDDLAISKAGNAPVPAEPALLGRWTAEAGKMALDLAKKKGMAKPAERTNFIRCEEVWQEN